MDQSQQFNFQLHHSTLSFESYFPPQLDSAISKEEFFEIIDGFNKLLSEAKKKVWKFVWVPIIPIIIGVMLLTIKTEKCSTSYFNDEEECHKETDYNLMLAGMGVMTCGAILSIGGLIILHRNNVMSAIKNIRQRLEKLNQVYSGKLLFRLNERSHMEATRNGNQTRLVTVMDYTFVVHVLNGSVDLQSLPAAVAIPHTQYGTSSDKIPLKQYPEANAPVYDTADYYQASDAAISSNSNKMS